MQEQVVALRRTARNSNSLAALAGAALRAGLPQGFRLGLADRAGRLPPGTRAVAFSFMTPELEAVRAEVQALSRLRPAPLLVAGGPHPSADPQGTLALGFDAVFVGEGEQTFPAFLAELAGGGRPRPVWRPRGARFDLDRAVHVTPALGLFPFAEISRGCPHACAFCQVGSLFGRRIRLRSPAVVAAGVGLAVQAGFHRIRFLASDAFAYGPRRGRAAALDALLGACQQAGARELFLGGYPSEVRPEHIEPALLEVVKRRCRNRTIQIGAQSGSDRVLDLMHRGHSVAQIRRAACLVREAGLKLQADLIFGFPGERPDDRRASLALADWLIQRCDAALHVHAYLPFPGTPAWPLPPELLESWVRDRLDRLERGGRLTGDWRDQPALAARILGWRAQGLILDRPE